MPTEGTGLRTLNIPNLLGGVSQQPDTLRLPSQAGEQIDGLSSIAEGLRKRPPTGYLQDLSSAFTAISGLEPIVLTTTPASPGVAQVSTVEPSVDDGPGTKYTVTLINIIIPINASLINASYTRLVSDTDNDTLDGIATAVDALVGFSAVRSGSVVQVTADVLDDAFGITASRDVSGVALPPGGLFVHSYARDLTERYAVIVVDGDLKVYNLVDGVEQTVNFPDGKTYLAVTAPGTDLRAVTVGDTTFIVNRNTTVADLTTLSPAIVNEALTWIRLGDYGVDYSITLDGTKYSHTCDVEHRDEITTEFIAQALLTKIPTGKDMGLLTLGSGYEIGDLITVTETSGTGMSAVYTVVGDQQDTSIVESIHSIAKGVANEINQTTLAATDGRITAYPVTTDDDFTLNDGVVVTGLISGQTFTFEIISDGSAVPTAENPTPQADTYDVVRKGSTLHLKRDDAADFTILASDGLGDQGIEVVKKKIQRFSDLPAFGVDGFRVEVTGDDTSVFDNYHVKYQDADSAEHEGQWIEDLKGGEKMALDPATMPHILVRLSNGDFDFKEATWENRKVGDLLSAPFPSFLGKKINDVFLYKNRLCVLAGENIIMSQAGEFFDFFRKSVVQLLDADIIDLSVAGEKVAVLRHAKPHAGDLILFSDQVQFPLISGDLLTPKTAAIGQATSFDASLRSAPVSSGDVLYFPVDRITSTGVLEYFLKNSDTGARDALDVTAPISSYLTGRPLKIASGPSMNMIAVATLADTNKLYVYKFFKDNGSVVQSAWSTWRFGNNSNILAVDFMENRLILVVQRGPTVTLEVMDITPKPTDPDAANLVHLDLKMTDATFGMSSAYAAGPNRTTWTLPFGVPEDTAFPLKVTNRATPASSDTSELTGITRPADNKIAATGDHTSASVWIGLDYIFEWQFSTLYLREGSESSGVAVRTDEETKVRDLFLKYDTTGKFTVEVLYTDRGVTLTSTFNGATDAEKGTFRVPILSDNENVTITIKNNSHRPSAFQGASWRGFISDKTRRL